MNTYALAVWDFETLHDGLMENQFGPDWFKQFPANRQPVVVEVNKLASAVSNELSVNWHDAVADWRYFSGYDNSIVQSDVTPIQVLNSGRGFSRLEPYVNSLFDKTPFIESLDELVIVGVSDTLLPLIERAREAGLKVTGIGVANFSDVDARELCDGFHDYADFIEPTTSVSTAGPDSAIADLVMDCMQELSWRTGNEWIPRVRIKPVVLKLDPSFDERALGYATFDAFLEDQKELLSFRHHFNEAEPEFRLKTYYKQLALNKLTSEQKRRNNQVTLYSRIASEQGLRLPEPEIIWFGLDVYAGFLRSGQTFKSFAELDEVCYRQLLIDLPYVTLTDSKKVRQVLFKCFLFSPGDGSHIGFREDIKTLADIEDLYFDLVTARVASKAPQPVSFEALSLAVTGETDAAEALEKKLASYHSQESL